MSVVEPASSDVDAPTYNTADDVAHTQAANASVSESASADVDAPTYNTADDVAHTQAANTTVSEPASAEVDAPTYNTANDMAKIDPSEHSQERGTADESGAMNGVVAESDPSTTAQEQPEVHEAGQTQSSTQSTEHAEGGATSLAQDAAEPTTEETDTADTEASDAPEEVTTKPTENSTPAASGTDQQVVDPEAPTELPISDTQHAANAAAADAYVSTDSDLTQVSSDGTLTSGKGKARAHDKEATSLDNTGTADEPTEELTAPSPAPSSKTPSPPPAMRYSLPIGGEGRAKKHRPYLSKSNSARTTTSAPNGFSGPSYSASGRQRTTSAGSNASTIKNASHDREQRDSVERPERSRRMSGSDIPDVEAATVASMPGDTAGRRRSNTVSARGEGKNGKKAARPKTAPAQPATSADAAYARFGLEKPGKLKRRETTSTVMVDGQMFTLGDEEQRRLTMQHGTRSLRDCSTTNDTSVHSSSHDHGIEGMLLTEGMMRNPRAALDEPMIYDEDEMDDIPPQGSYAIHPPSRRRLAEAADLSLYNEDGESVRFGSIFEQQRTLIIFLRHWFCPFCQMFAQSIQKVDPLPLQRADLGMVVVGQGHWHVTKSYKEVMKIPSFVRMYADPTRKIYTALGMTLRTNDAGPACTRPDYQTMGVLKASLVAIKKGVVDMPIRMPGDVKLLGGEFILGPGLQCSFTHRMVTTRGHLDLPRVLSQAGCDLSLKTPKDVLAERDSASRRRPGSTRSVDRITARRIARRIARKTRPSQDTTLAIRSKKAAAAAAGDGKANSIGEGGGRRSGAFHSVRGLPPPLPLTMPRSISKHFGSVGSPADTLNPRSAAAALNEENMVGVDGTVSAVPAEATDYSVDGGLTSSTRRGSASAATSRARKTLANGLQTGFARTVAMGNATADKARQAAQRIPVSRSNNGQQQQLGEEEEAEWADVYPAAPPPLPRTSSADAFSAAALRQQQSSEDVESLHSDVLARGNNNRSTMSLGRSSSSNARNHLRQRDHTRRIMARSTLSSPDLHDSANGGRHRRTNSGTSQTSSIASSNGRPMVPVRTTSNTSLPLQGAAGMTHPVSQPQKRSSGNGGVPLSVFEKRIIGKPRPSTGHSHSYSTDDAASLGLAPSPRAATFAESALPLSPVAAAFGEDTDYKRLSRSALEAPPPTANDATPKGRIISLYADEVSAPASPAARDNRASILANGGMQQNGFVSDVDGKHASPDVPPPVPPKSPRRTFVAPAQPPAQQTPRVPVRYNIPSRVPAPASTPLFASILAAETARQKNASQTNLSSAADSQSATQPTTLNDGTSAVDSTASTPIRSTSGGAGPALFAGLPSLRSPAQPTSQPQTPSQTQPPYSGNPLQAFAMSHSRDSSMSSNSHSTAHRAINGISNVDPPTPKAAPRQVVEPASTPKAAPKQELPTLQPVVATPTSALKSPISGFGAGSFLDDLETVDGFRNTRNASMTPSGTTEDDESAAASYDGDDDDEMDYNDEWAPLQARQNFVPARPVSDSATSAASSMGQLRLATPRDSIEEQDEAEHDDDEDDWSENDTQEGEEEEEEEEEQQQGQNSGHLALLGVLSKGARREAAPGAYVVKRVTSRPSTAPSSVGAEGDVPASTSGSAPNSPTTASASARKVQLGRLLKPQSAGGLSSNAGRRLTSFREEEEEEQAN